MRETHSVMISRAVQSTEVGFHVWSSGVFSGHPSVDIGQRPDENHVSRTSGSC
jgi:hypothetical protein